MKTVRKTTVWDRVQATATEHGSALDEIIDNFTASGYKNKFNAAKYLKGYELSGPVVKILAQYYRPHLEELREVEAGTDPELTAAYRVTGKALRRYIEFMESLVAACEDVVEKAAVQRKPRARKIKPPEVQVANMKYLVECPELNLVGIPLERLIGSSEAWFYDVEKRKLILYKALDRDGLGAKGTTILNYDEKASGMHTVRKPTEFFKEPMIGYRAFSRAWTMIKGKVTPLKGRTNDAMILLAVA